MKNFIKMMTFLFQCCCFVDCPHWYENVVILTKFSSLVVLEVIILTISSAAIDENFIKISISVLLYSDLVKETAVSGCYINTDSDYHYDSGHSWKSFGIIYKLDKSIDISQGLFVCIPGICLTKYLKLGKDLKNVEMKIVFSLGNFLLPRAIMPMEPWPYPWFSRFFMISILGIPTCKEWNVVEIWHHTSLDVQCCSLWMSHHIVPPIKSPVHL